MWADVKNAARDGIVLGVKYGMAAVLILIAVSWLLGDYAVVRQRAQSGQAAFDFLNQQVANANAKGQNAKPVQ